MTTRRCVRVIFRRFHEKYPSGEMSDEVIALFPDMPSGRGFVTSYMHVGQHGDASYPGLMKTTRPARSTDPDVIALTKELRRIGYKLCPRRQIGRAHV